MTTTEPTNVQIFVDPMCPFAWLTSRSLVEVERLGRIELTIRVMSLSILNEGRDDVSNFYRDLVDRAWMPARIAIDALLVETLAAVGLPTTLLTESRADTATADTDIGLRASHRCAVESVGNDVGTPVVHIVDDDRTIAFFGPVVNPAPVGTEAVQLFDGVALVAGTPGFFELKRTRTGPLVFA